MSYLFNISIVIPASRKQAFIDWANGEGRLAAASDTLRGFNCLMVPAIPGDKDFDRSPDRTFSLQMKFDSLKDCRAWHVSNFDALMGSYARWHGPDPLFFATILKDTTAV